MITDIRGWLARTGFPSDIEISPMAPGLGHTTLWRITGPDTHGDLVLRVFPTGDTVVADREALAMGAAGAAGLPVPAVLATGEIEDRRVLLISLVPGATVAAALEEAERAFALGETLGTLLGRLNAIAAPADLAPRDAWLDRAGPALAPLRGRLAAMPNADRLLHLDYHPENVLLSEGEVTGIIDWTNALAGPPHIDLGRSRATLQTVRLLPTVPPEVAATVEQFVDGLVTGHAAVHGPDPEPDLSLAWGFGTICVDFSRHVERPGTWVTPELVAALEERRDALIARVVG